MHFFPLFISFTFFASFAFGLKEGECEVCRSVIEKFQGSLSDDEKSDSEKISNAFKRFCKTVQGKDERLCYYIGGLETSATYIVNEMAKPMSWGVPVDKICEKLKLKDAQICELKYEKRIDLSDVNLKKLKVSELKNILSSWNAVCKGCTEKSEFVRMVEELMPTHDPEAYKKRQANPEL